MLPLGNNTIGMGCDVKWTIAPKKARFFIKIPLNHLHLSVFALALAKESLTVIFSRQLINHSHHM